MNRFMHRPIYLLLAALFASYYGYAGYIGNFSGASISILNTQTSTVAGLVNDPLHLLNAIFYITFAPNGKTAYVANYAFSEGTSTILYIDVAANAVQGSVAGGPFGFINSFAITPDGTKLYAIANDANIIYVIDTATNTFLHSITGSFATPYFMVITPDGTKGYIANFNNNTVSIVDIATDTVTGVITNAAIINPYSLALTPDGATLYVGNYINSITVISVPTNSVTGTITSSLLTQLDYIAITPNGKTAYVCNSLEGNVAVIDLATNAIALINDASFNGNYYLAISNDGKNVYVPNELEGSVSIINTATNTVTGAVQDPQNTFDGPYAIALLPAPYPPRSVSGCRAYNRFLTQIDIMNILTWVNSYSGSAVSRYLIYRDSGPLALAGVVPATGILQFVDHNQQNIPMTYYVVAQNTSGSVSLPVSVTVTQNCNS